MVRWARDELVISFGIVVFGVILVSVWGQRKTLVSRW
jgi:hypothetical protein